MASKNTASLEDAQVARVELYRTLAQLSDRLDYAQRFDDAVDRTRSRLQRRQRENPVGFAVLVAGVAVTVGVVAWAGTAQLLKRMR